MLYWLCNGYPSDVHTKAASNGGNGFAQGKTESLWMLRRTHGASAKDDSTGARTEAGGAASPLRKSVTANAVNVAKEDAMRLALMSLLVIGVLAWGCRDHRQETPADAHLRNYLRATTRIV